MLHYTTHLLLRLETKWNENWNYIWKYCKYLKESSNVYWMILLIFLLLFCFVFILIIFIITQSTLYWFLQKIHIHRRVINWSPRTILLFFCQDLVSLIFFFFLIQCVKVEDFWTFRSTFYCIISNMWTKKISVCHKLR